MIVSPTLLIPWLNTASFLQFTKTGKKKIKPFYSLVVLLLQHTNIGEFISMCFVLVCGSS